MGIDVGQDLATTVPLDELDAIEAEIEALRPRPAKVLRYLLLSLVILGGAELAADLSYALYWVGGYILLTGILSLPTFLKLRALAKERDRLLERRGGLIGQPARTPDPRAPPHS